MNNKILQLASLGAFVVAVSGCSHIVKNHSNDYQNDVVNAQTLQIPEGSLQSRDALVIPHENIIPNVEKHSKFIVPRAEFVFYPMANIQVSNQSDRMILDVPENTEQSKNMVKDFLMALHGDGQSVATDKDENIISVPFEFIKQGWWASLWSDISRNFPEKIVFSFSFFPSENGTFVSVQYRVEQKGEEPTAWMTPTSRNDIYVDAIRLWSDMGRQVNNTSAYFSERGKNTPYHVWTDHRGIFAIHLNTTDSLAAQLKAAGLIMVPGKEKTLSVMPSPESENNRMTAPKKENDNALSWDEREYKYDITRQKAGDFLVLDVSSLPNPEITSFLLAQCFVK